MNQTTFFTQLKFFKEIPPHAVIVKFTTTDPGLGAWNDILFSVNKNFVDQNSLKNMLHKEFSLLANEKLPEEFDTTDEFLKLEMKENFVDFLAISLIAFKALPDDIHQELKVGTYLNPEGVLMVVLDKNRLEISDYFLAIREFLNNNKFDVQESNIFIQLLLGMSEVDAAIERIK